MSGTRPGLNTGPRQPTTDDDGAAAYDPKCRKHQPRAHCNGNRPVNGAIDLGAVVQGLMGAILAAVGWYLVTLRSEVKQERMERIAEDAHMDAEMATAREAIHALERNMLTRLSEVVTRTDLRQEIDRLLVLLRRESHGGD